MKVTEQLYSNFLFTTMKISAISMILHELREEISKDNSDKEKLIKKYHTLINEILEIRN